MGLFYDFDFESKQVLFIYVVSANGEIKIHVAATIPFICCRPFIPFIYFKMNRQFVCVTGLSANVVRDALSGYVRDKVVYLGNESDRLSSPDKICIFESDESAFANVAEVNEKCEILTEKLVKAGKTLQTFHEQQQALFDEFVLLRQKYDDLKASLVQSLWFKCAPYHPDLTDIPAAESSNFNESESVVGKYNIGAPLGEGQFATVLSCSLSSLERGRDSTGDLAIKVIKKERIVSFASLCRISQEIRALCLLGRSKYVVFMFYSTFFLLKMYVSL